MNVHIMCDQKLTMSKSTI